MAVSKKTLISKILLLGFLLSTCNAETLLKKINEIDKLRSGFSTPFDEVEKRCNELLEEYPDPNDQGKIYFELVQVEGQSGFQRPAKILEFINKALECPQEPLKKTRLYIYWGDAIQVANRGVHNQELIVARHEAAIPYLLGLKETLKYNLPEKKPVVPMGTFYNYDYLDPNEIHSESMRKMVLDTIREVERKQKEQFEAQQKAVFLGDMISHRDILNSQIAYMYSRFPWASKEIRELATEMLQDKTAVDRLMEQVDKGVQKRIKELGLEPQLPDNILAPPENVVISKENPNLQSGIEVKNILIPDANTALKQGKNYVLDMKSGSLLNPGAQVNSEQMYNNILKLGKGDIAWDGSILAVRKAKALTIVENSDSSLKYIPGKWCNHYKLPDKVNLPYSVVIVTNEGINYLVTIQKIETEGITISYKSLSANEVNLYIKTEEDLNNK